MQVTSSVLVLLLPWLLAGPEGKELRQVTYPEETVSSRRAAGLLVPSGPWLGAASLGTFLMGTEDSKL